MTTTSLATLADGPAFRACEVLAGEAIEVRQRGTVLSARDGKAELVSRLHREAGGHALSVAGAAPGVNRFFHLACATLEYLFSTDAECDAVSLQGECWATVLPLLQRLGLCTTHGRTGAVPQVRADMFWQVPDFWMARPRSAYPRHDIYDGRTAHPQRPPKPAGRIYTRYIPWLEGSLSFDVATFEDLPLVHRWMNMPRVNEFWREAGDMEHHRAYLSKLFDDPHILPLIGRFGEEAFSYFEIYWAKEDLIGTYCDAADYDRGCHVIVGEDAFRGRDWFTAWLPCLLHLMFLDDARTERLVQEPQSNHHRQLRNLQRSGFSHIKTVDFPGKRAAILSISRQRFFSERLWHPQPSA